MACERWNDDWVAHLYGEDDVEQERAMRAHLEICGACRETMDGLRSARRLLIAATPPVPAMPGVLLPRRRSVTSRVWAFAGGVACAVLVFAAGVLAGPWVLGSADDDRLAHLAESHRELEQRLAAMEARAEAASYPVPSVSGPADVQRVAMTRSDVESLLADWQRRVEVERARELTWLVEEVVSSKARSEQALRYAVLQSDPRIRQH